MIERLKKNISVLMVLLLAVFFVVVIVAFDVIAFRSNMDSLKSDIYSEVQVIGWRSFLYGEGEDTQIQDMEYGIVNVGDDGTLTVTYNGFEKKSNEDLIILARRVLRARGSRKRFLSFVYIVKTSDRLGKNVVIADNSSAISATLATIAWSIVVGIAGIALFIFAAMALSRWLVRPVEDSISAEKEFISNAGHELKTPLAVIRANTDLLASEHGEDKRIRYIRQETERMTELVGKMLTLVRLDMPMREREHRKFRADEAFCDVIYPMEGVAYEKHISVEINVADEMWIWGDEEELKSLMSILLDNALCYTPEGGSIKIDAEIRDKKLNLDIINSGTPIPPEMRERLFDRFYRMDEAHTSEGGHFGLGLSIAKGIVFRHRGTIRADEAEGGNRFAVTIPVGGQNSWNRVTGSKY
ncbi:MAG: HAMP domain-containing histidine kinase [Clostridiales bacterium]|nr:HAMP domain-containing histidine kinase [Clostridiales bacterium]